MIRELVSKKDFTWFDVQEPETDDFRRLSEEFSLPYLLVQDCLRPEHLPKYEKSDDAHFLMMRSFDADYQNHDTSIQELTRKIALFITEDKLISIHRVGLPFLNDVAEKSKKSTFPHTIHEYVHQIILATIKTY